MADIAVEGQEVAQTDPISSFSFDSVHEKALNYDANTPVETPEQVAAAVVAEPVVAAEPATNIDTASAGKLAQLSDTDLVEITVDGQTVQMPWAEAKGGFQRQNHYTKNMQALRQEQTAFAAEREAAKAIREEREALVTVMRNQELMKEFLEKTHPSLLQQAQAIEAASQAADPNDIATVGQIEAAKQSLIAEQQRMQSEFLQSLEKREEDLTQKIEDKQEIAKLSANINTTIAGLFKEAPYIAKLIPNAEQVLRYDVLQLRPQSHEETVEAFKTVFGGYVENYKAAVAETNKAAVLAKQKLVTNNIQPPGGTAPQQAPTSFRKTNPMTGKPEVNWDALREAALNYGK